MDFLYFIAVCYGMTAILVWGKIFNKIRPKSCYFHCMQCVGFAVGIFWWLLNNQTELFTFDYSLTTGFALACLSSGASYVIGMLFDDEGLRLKWK